MDCRAALLGVTCWGLAAVASAGEPQPCDDEQGWTQRLQNQTLTVWDHAGAKGSGVRAQRVGGIIEAPPAAVWAALIDFPHYDRIFPFSEQVKVVGTEDDGKRIFFYSMVAPPFVTKRDYTLNVHLDKALPAEGRYRLSFVAGNDHPGAPPPVPGVVRVMDANGYWEVKTWGMGFSHAMYCVRVDPGGQLPAFMVNAAQLDVMPKMFAGLRKAAGAPDPK